MAIRLEVLPDLRIELMRITDGKITTIYFESMGKAVRVIQYLLKRDLRQAKKDRFVSELDSECKRELKRAMGACNR